MLCSIGRRRAQEKKPIASSGSRDLETPVGPVDAKAGDPGDSLDSDLAICPTSEHGDPFRLSPQHAEYQFRRLLRFEEWAYQQYILGLPRLDLLLTLIKFNVFRALLENNRAMGLGLEILEDEAVSTFYSDNMPGSIVEGGESGVKVLALQPTAMQRRVEHHPWIDIFPFPRMRDNILGAGEEFDDVPLCQALIEICGPANDEAGILVWGDPWDPKSWEVSEGFAKKWGWVIAGCSELFTATNHWRARRGQRNLFPEP